MAKIQQREKVFLGGGGIALVLIAAFAFGQGPMEKYRRSATLLSSSRLRLQEAQLWNAEVESARQQVESLRAKVAQQGGFDLWTHIDGVVKALSLGTRANISSKKGAASISENRVTAVELQLKGVSLKELVDLLHRIYANDYLILIDKVDHIKPAQDGQGLDCRMTFVSPRV